MNKFSYIKSLWSPFVPFKIKFYVGKTKIGTPYFLPRRWVKDPNNPGYQKAIDKKQKIICFLSIVSFDKIIFKKYKKIYHEIV